ncbi:hypothetical protein PuT2_11360 [Pusillimonas sp. T2]|uniref:hypothetical protein n=1 Tax=Pusillimonas sp. T2 TaxID=1548123 RepID=UPI000B9CDE1C|nr:hypothetical protein [Pusillimonas sp. T2]OXR48564.1 hypothetical protein PuT2_11360 [Pusillimonas sp. T2]
MTERTSAHYSLRADSIKGCAPFVLVLAFAAFVPGASFAQYLSLPRGAGIEPVNKDGLMLDYLDRVEPRSLLSLAQSARCSVRASAPSTVLSDRIGPVHLIEYMVTPPCSLTRGGPAISGFGQLQSQYGSHRMGFVYGPGKRAALFDHIAR